MAKPLEEWSIDELRMEAVRVADELARRAATPGVRGLAWDETFTLEMVDDEFSLHERKAGQELPPFERERLVQLWLAVRAERHRDAA